MTIIEETPTDAELVARVRDGDTEAYGELWARHVDVARGLARRITSRDPDDLIGESYTRILTAIQAGRGPDTAFRPYLMSTIRRVNIDNARRYQMRVVPTDSPEVLDPNTSESTEDVAMRRAEGSSAIAAWQSLPAETRDLLWDLVVMDETPAGLSGKLGMSPNAVASRARRARERLRQAYLSQLVSSNSDDECRLIRSDFGAYVRGSLGATRRETIDEHLETCARCRAAVADLRSVDDMIRLRVVPFLPVVALGAAHTLSDAASVTLMTKKGLAVLKPQLARVPGLPGPAGFIAAACGLAAAIGITTVLLSGGHDVPAAAAKRPAPVASSPPITEGAGPITPAATPAASPAATPVQTPRASGSTPVHTVHTVHTRTAAPVAETPSAVPSVVPQLVSSRPAPSTMPPLAPNVTEPPEHSPRPPATQPSTEVPDPGGQESPEDLGPPVTPDAPSVPVTIALAPRATTTTLIKLRVPHGWMITAVGDLSDHPSNRKSHLPARSFVGFVEPGPVTVVLTQTSQPSSAGSLAYEFLARGGKLDRGEHSLP